MARQAEVLALAVPASTDAADGFITTQDGRNAYLYRAVLVYDPALDAMVHQVDGRTYPDNGRGAFERPGEPPLLPGWTAVIGVDNYATALRDSVRNPQIVGVLTWTFVFAFRAVPTTFGLGTFLALVFNDPRIRGRRLYRVIMLLPYGFPAFMSILVWGGMFNPSYGFINDTLLGGVRIPWLDDPLLAKASILLVNLWLDFPYFFLVATGALQAIPAELEEAAVLDGANRWALFRRIRFPLMLVSLAPLLIASFAFAINNYTLIWLLTQGQPVKLGSMNGIGETDILITMVYKIAFGAGDLTGGGNPTVDYGLASAYSTLIFVIVGAISIWSYRRTRKLEEVF
ncbi:MAG: ABC transporter permease subunit [Chloroflexota bacterium]